MVISNKRGWIRIMEASLAILMIVGVVLFFYSRSFSQAEVSENIFDIQKNVLDEISADYELRQKVLDGNESFLFDFARVKIPVELNFTLRVCDLVDSDGDLVPCNMETYVDADVYVEEKIISGDVDEFKLKKIRLFVWRV